MMPSNESAWRNNAHIVHSSDCRDIESSPQFDNPGEPEPRHCDKCAGAHTETDRYSDCIAFWRENAREASDLLSEIWKVATGEIQVANDDTEALAVIARWINGAQDHCHACQMETENCTCHDPNYPSAH